MKPNLLLTLPEQPLVIIGDIHGEVEALDALLDRINHDPTLRNRRLVFIGDLCDRGPDSVGVIMRVRELIDQGRAWAILGNHEINLLANDAKDGSGWFFDSRMESDQPFYAPFTRATASQRPEIREFLAGLPLAILMPGLRMVHAAWDASAIQAIAPIPSGQVLEQIHEWNLQVRQAAAKEHLRERYQAELDRWARQIEDPHDPPPYLDAVADYETLEQRINPIKRLTSGIEARCSQPFFSGNRWRYSDRIAWWNQDQNRTPLLIGHYWRLFEPPSSVSAWRYSLLFQDIIPTAWHGRHQHVFCIDYSVGARWRERKASGGSISPTKYRLAGMTWPERELIFDNGDHIPTI